MTLTAATATRPFWPIWGIVPAFLVHDGEEAWYLADRGEGVVALFSGVQTTVAESIAAMAIELVLFTLIAWFAWRSTAADRTPGRPVAMPLFVMLMSAWALHGVMHLGGAVLAGGYAMGAITALPICVLYGVWALRRLYVGGLVTRRWLLVSPFLAALAFAPVLGAAHNLGRLLA